MDARQAAGTSRQGPRRPALVARGRAIGVNLVYCVSMCRNVRPLTNFSPPASDAEIRDAALQFVRKISGSTKPSRANEAAFNKAVDDIAKAATKLVRSYSTKAPPRTREEEARKAAARNFKRFGRAGSVFDHEIRSA